MAEPRIAPAPGTPFAHSGATAGRIDDSTVGAAVEAGGLAAAHADRVGNDALLLLDSDAWVLLTPIGVRRQALEGAPAAQLERLKIDTLARNAPLRVVVHDMWLRHLVVSWPKGVSGRAERDAWLAHRFRDVHGASGPEWTLATDRDSIGSSVLASAVPTALLAAIHVFVRRHRLRLDGVVGDFVASFNRWQPGFRESRDSLGALAVIRGRRVTAGLWRDGEWRAMRSQAFVGENASATLANMLDTWTLTEAGARGSDLLPVGVLHAIGPDVDAPAGWRLERCVVRR